MAIRGALLALSLHSSSGLDNGLALTPPMGWRSWNSLGGDVAQKDMEEMMIAMTVRNRTVDGKPTSLLDVGYSRFGLDDGWQNMSLCNSGWQGHGTFHDASGRPMVNTTRFPDMRGMTDYAHSLGLSTGWYLNNCICKDERWSDRLFKEPSWMDAVYKQSAQAIVDFGFDSVKLDGCSEYLDLQRWSDVLNATGKKVMVENCHWGCTTPSYPNVWPVISHANAICAAHDVRPPWPISPHFPIQNDGRCDGTEDVSRCPYHTYRTSFDINAHWHSMISNLHSVIPFLGDPPLSRPGAWADPDMLEVGQLASFEEDRSHFGAWCIVSAPLVLGLDLRNEREMTRVWDIITNIEAIEVNQAWAGHPGKRVSMDSQREVWSKPLGGGRLAVLLLSNGAAENETVTLQLSDLGIQDAVTVRDIWKHEHLPGTYKSNFVTDRFGGHDSRFYVFTTHHAMNTQLLI